MHLDAYLRRIGIDRPARPDLAALRAIHRAHLFAIPYENLDVQLGRAVTIERPAIFEKIVNAKRGGWCYEMNGLLGWALGELGFKVTRATGAVMREAMGDASNGNHLVLRVELEEGLYLADAGFGDGPIDPIRIAPGDFGAHGFHFGLSRVDRNWWRLHNDPRGGAKSFDFNLAPADETLFERKCEMLQTSPMSPFVQNAVCQRFTKDGLVILRGRTLRHLTAAGVSERLLESERDFLDILKSEFTLDVPQAASLWPKICARHEAVFASDPKPQ